MKIFFLKKKIFDYLKKVKKKIKFFFSKIINIYRYTLNTIIFSNIIIIIIVNIYIYSLEKFNYYFNKKIIFLKFLKKKKFFLYFIEHSIFTKFVYFFPKNNYFNLIQKNFEFSKKKFLNFIFFK